MWSFKKYSSQESKRWIRELYAAVLVFETISRTSVLADKFLRLLAVIMMLNAVNSHAQSNLELDKLKADYDSLFTARSDQNIQTLKTQYDIERKANDMALLEARQQKAKNQRLFVVATALCILLFSMAVIYGLKQKAKRNKLEREKLSASLEFKEIQLATHALYIAHKNEVLLSLKSQLKDIKKDKHSTRHFQSMINNINSDINNDQNWKQFKSYFEAVHKDFNSKVLSNYPEVSNKDLRLMSLLKMNLSSKEIANMLNISVEGVKKARYRLRKKLNLTSDQSLQDLVIAL
jgi:DNA-binding CsgD family transcriptional regulator